MLYTPEELYQWGMEEGYGPRMILCKDYNLHNFGSTAVDGVIKTNEETSEYEYSIGLPDGEVIDVPFPQAADFSPEMRQFFMDRPEQLLAEVITYEEQSMLTFATGETDDLRMMNLNRNIILHMLSLLKINTKGKFKVLMEEASLLKAADEERQFVQAGIKDSLEQ